MLKLALKIAELLLGTKISDENPRADMYLLPGLSLCQLFLCLQE